MYPSNKLLKPSLECFSTIYPVKLLSPHLSLVYNIIILYIECKGISSACMCTHAQTYVGMFLDSCEDLKTKRDLLGSVQKLLDIPITPYLELDQTEKDISYLSALYRNYQHFLAFDKR